MAVFSDSGIVSAFHHRQQIEDEIERLIGILDALDGDPDAEPDAEPDADDEENGDREADDASNGLMPCMIWDGMLLHYGKDRPASLNWPEFDARATPMRRRRA